MTITAPTLAAERTTGTVALEEPTERMGAGACSISGCPCPAFQQTYGSDLCSNCGHKYTDHW